MVHVNRRAFLGTTAVGIAIGASGADALAQNAAKPSVVALRTSQLSNPLGLTDEAPRLSWQLAGSRRGLTQIAYRIRVARSAETLAVGGADLWDSGRVTSAASTGIPYEGKALTSRERAWWTVTLWDEQGATLHATAAAWWEQGLNWTEDWTATWLAAETVADKADREAGMQAVTAPVAAAGKTRLFRLPFVAIESSVATVTLHASGFLQNLSVNGKPIPVPDHPYASFGPPPALRFRIALDAGPNVVATEVTPPRPILGGTSHISIAGQIRMNSPGKPASYINEGWQTADAETIDWRLPGRSSDGWGTPALASPQPITAWPASPAVQMRRPFTARSGVARARLYVTALGAYELRLNGRKIGDDLLQSESSDFRKTILARAYDVTALMREGDNVLGAVVGDGWYASYMAPVGRYPFGPAPRRLLAQLELTHADGSRDVVQTGDGWKLAPSPVLASELYNGETYDARLETAGWDAPGFNDAGWSDCWAAEKPPGKLVFQASPPIRVTRTLKPVSIKWRKAGFVVVDFGQNFAGLVKLRIKGRSGQTITMRFSEILRADGTVDQSNLRAAQATDRYTLRGDPSGESYTPLFTYHGFRYVQIEGLPDNWSVEGLVTSSDLPETGVLRIDNPVVEKLWLNTLWSQRSNFVAIPTDCPQRDERLGWTGDAQVFWDAATFNMDVGAFTRRFLHDLRDAQGPTGAFPIFAPTAALPSAASPGWADAGVMLPWTCWRRYGDTGLIDEHWSSMARYIEGVLADNPDFIWRNVRTIDFGDWLALDAVNPGDATTPKALVATAMLKRSLDQLADMAEATGRRIDGEGYRAKSEATAQAFQNAFVNADGSVGNGSHTGYILAIRLGLLKPEQKKIAGEKLIADIRNRGTLISSGFLGTPLSLDAIADTGDVDLVYDLLLRTEFPSWGYMVTKGATTIWERWNSDTGDVSMNSYNHYALGAVCGFLYRRIAGIEETAPGFAEFRVRPLLDPRVPSGGADYDSVRGRISTRWSRRHGGGFLLDVTVPGNTRAEIHLPSANEAMVTEAGRSLDGRVEFRRLGVVAGRVAVSVGAGAYSFRSALDA